MLNLSSSDDESTLPFEMLAEFAVDMTVPSHGSAEVKECWPTSTTWTLMLVHVVPVPVGLR